MALPVIEGRKTEREKFAGADHTYSIEAMMGDGKALQAGTSHHLGQNFAKAFDVTFQTQQGTREFVYRHELGPFDPHDRCADHGSWRRQRHRDSAKTRNDPAGHRSHFQKTRRAGAGYGGRQPDCRRAARAAGIGVKVDERDQHSPGWKFNDWEKRGVPLRMEIGPKDLDKNQAVLARRDSGEKAFVSQDGIAQTAVTTLAAIQSGLFEKALAFREKNSQEVDDYGKFGAMLDAGGFLWSHWCDSDACEERVKNETKATIRCIPTSRKSGIWKVRRLRQRLSGPSDFRASLLMSDDRSTWIRQSFQLALVTAGFHVLQFLASAILWMIAGSASLAAFGLDAIVSAFASFVLAARIHRSFETLGDNWRSRGAAIGYLAGAAIALYLAVAQLWWRHWSTGAVQQGIEVHWFLASFWRPCPCW